MLDVSIVTKNEHNLKNEDNLTNEDDPKNEVNLKKWRRRIVVSWAPKRQLTATWSRLSCKLFKNFIYGSPHPLLLISLHLVHQVHVDGEGDVLHQNQAVSSSYSSQDEVDGVGPHVLVGQHHQVHHVEDCSHQANNQGQVTMKRCIVGLDR